LAHRATVEVFKHVFMRVTGCNCWLLTSAWTEYKTSLPLLLCGNAAISL
jgi:hypothetical protein